MSDDATLRRRFDRVCKTDEYAEAAELAGDDWAYCTLEEIVWGGEYTTVKEIASALLYAAEDKRDWDSERRRRERAQAANESGEQ